MLRPGTSVKTAWIATVLCVSFTSAAGTARADEGVEPGAPAPAGMPAEGPSDPVPAAPSAPAKPSYAGKDAAWWIGELEANDRAEVAILVLRRMGAAVHADLAAAFLDPRPQVRRQAAHLLAELAVPGDVGSLPVIVGPPGVQAVAKGLEDSNAAVRADAARVLSRWREAARPALPRLAAQCRDVDPVARRAAVDAIRALGMRDLHVVKAALAGLDDPSREVRDLALWVLREVKAGSVDEAPLLLEALRVAKPESHAPVLAALGFLGPDAPGVLPALVQGAASGPTPTARGAAITALGRCAPRSPEAVRALVGCLAANDPGDRRSAAQALLPVAGQLVEHRNAIILAFEPSDPILVSALSSLLAGMGEGAELALPTLIAVASRCPSASPTVLADLLRMGRVAVRPSVRSLADVEPEVRSFAAQVCASLDEKLLGSYRDEIATRAIARLEDSDGAWSERWAVVSVAVRVPPVLPAIAQRFHSALLAYLERTTEPEVERRACVEGLLRFADMDRRASPLATRAANAWLRRKGVSTGDRLALLGSLSNQSGNGADTVLALQTYLDDPDVALAERAAVDLAGSEPGRLVLVETMGGESVRARLVAITGLSRAPNSAIIRPTLVAHLRDPSSEVRTACARALLRLSMVGSEGGLLLAPDVEDLSVVLAESLSAPQASTRSWAAVSLLSLGHGAKTALPALLLSASDPSCLREELESVVSAIEAIDHRAWDPLLPAFEKSLMADESHVRAGSAFLLATASPEAHAEPVTRFATPLLEDPDPRVRRTALLTLSRIGPAAAGVARFVVARLDGTSTDEAALAAATLGSFAPDSMPALEGLTTMLLDPRRGDRAAATAPIARFGRRAVGPLLEAMKTQAMRRPCVAALAAIGPEAAAALPALEAAAQDPNPDLALEARRAVEAVREDRR